MFQLGNRTLEALTHGIPVLEVMVAHQAVFYILVFHATLLAHGVEVLCACNHHIAFSDGQQRYRTGEKCEVSGCYTFDGYVDGTHYPSPHPQEREIPVSRSETFPPIRSAGKACYWKLTLRI